MKGWGHGHVQNLSVSKGSPSVEPGISYPGSTPWERDDAQPVAAPQEKGWGLQPVVW